MFPSLDYTLSFHIGLIARVQAKRKGTENERLGDRLAVAFRKWEQAAEALDRSAEAEEIQAVGMRCRECLIAFIMSVSDLKMVPVGRTAPKAADFIQWSELMADTIAVDGSPTLPMPFVTMARWQLMRRMLCSTLLARRSCGTSNPFRIAVCAVGHFDRKQFINLNPT